MQTIPPEVTETLVCPACLEENLTGHFCRNGAPVGTNAAVGPLNRYCRGLCRSEAENPRKAIVVLGMFGVLLPIGVVGVSLVVLGLPQRDYGNLLLGGILAGLSIAILFRTTLSYVRRHA